MTSYMPPHQPQENVSPASSTSPQEVLLKLLRIEREARQAENSAALRFTAVNAPRQLLDYRQAVLWCEADGVLAISGLSEVDRNAPFVRWLNAFLRSLDRKRGELKRADFSVAVQTEWQAWLPEYLWLEPLPFPASRANGGASGLWLLLCRPQAWNTAEQTLLGEMGEALGHAFSMFRARRPWQLRKKMAIVAGVIVLGLLVPVRQTVMAPAEVVPVEPVMVRVSLDGVVDKFHVTPNETVTAGQPLFDLDPTKLESSLEVARNTLTVAEADYRQVAQQALLDPRAKAMLVLKKGEVDRRDAEMRYLETLKERLTLKAPVNGIAVFSDVNDWIGRSVAVGEKVLDIADASRVEFIVHLPVQDMMPMPANADVDVFLNITPDTAIPAKVHYLSYQAEPTPEGVVAYRIRAALDNATQPPRVGLRGVAKLYGERVTFGYWLFRRPLGLLRQWLGF